MREKVTEEDFQKALENAGPNLNRKMRRHLKHRKEGMKAAMAQSKNQNYTNLKNSGGIGSLDIGAHKK
jgi:ribosome-associated translation inhibitor RaiA